MTMCFCYYPRYEIKHIKFLNVPPNNDLYTIGFFVKTSNTYLVTPFCTFCNKRHTEQSKLRLKTLPDIIKTTALASLCDTR